MAPVLWILLGLFVLRVAGQGLVAFLDVDWLPPMDQWYSGLLVYRYLLPAQVLIIALYAVVCIQFSRGSGYFVESRPWFARQVLWFGYVYLVAMLIRYPAQHLLRPSDHWYDDIIPIVFHWVLAAFIIVFGRFHRQRLGAGAS